MRNLLFILFFCSAVLARSQTGLPIDSLKLLVKQAKNDTLKIKAQNVLAYELSSRNLYTEAIEAANYAITLNRDYQKKKLPVYTRLLARSYNVLGGIYWDQGNFDKALEISFKALKLQETIGDVGGQGRSTYIIGMVHFSQKKYEKSLDFLYKSLKLRQVISDTGAWAANYNGIGLVYFAMGKNEDALTSYFKAYKINDRAHKKSYLASNCNNIGEVYQKKGDFTKAIQFCNKALQLRTEVGDRGGTAYSYNNLAYIYLKLKKADIVKDLALKSLAISLQTGEKPAILEAYDALNQADSLSGNYEDAYKHYRLYSAFKDSMLGETSTKNLAELQLKYDTEKKDAAIRLLKVETAAERRSKLFIIFGLALALILIGAIGLAYRNTKRYNKFLTEEESRKELLLREVHHRTNNSLQLMSAMLAMQSDEIEDEKAKRYLQQSESRIHSMSALHTLLNEDTSQLSVVISEYLGMVIDFHQGLTQAVEMTVNIPASRFPAKLALPIALITNEVITNSLKYAFPADWTNPHIHIALGPSSQTHWTLEITDNGKGIPDESLQSNQGSIGSILITVLTRQIDGELNVSNNPGASVKISFPFGL